MTTSNKTEARVTHQVSSPHPKNSNYNDTHVTISNDKNAPGESDERKEPAREIMFLFVNIDRYSKKIQFVLLTGGIFFFYLLYGYFQELIFQLEGFKPYGWYLTLVQFAFYATFGKLEFWIWEHEKRRIPLRTYFFLAFLTLMTMGLSNTSVGYLNYPTQVMFKCCKLIPVLIGSIIIQGKKYGSLDFAAACCMSIGLIFFTLADSKVSPKFDIVGVNMISFALVADAIIGNVQEKAMKTHKASNIEVVFYSYFIGFFYLLAGAITMGELVPAVEFCAKHPVETYGYGAVFSATGYFGINLVLSLIKVSGVFVAVTVTTFRKSLSIIMSFLLFSKPFTFQYVWSGLLVILGIYLNLSAKMNLRWPLDILVIIRHNIARAFACYSRSYKKICLEI